MLGGKQEEQPPVGASIKALKDPATGHIATQPADILRIVEDFEAPLMLAHGGARTGLYLPKDRPPGDHPPWARKGAVDRMDLATKANPQDGTGVRTRRPLAAEVRDWDTYQEVLQALAKGKAPGPDEVTNELQKKQPTEKHHNKQELFCIMWASACTPTVWTASLTVLLF